MYIYRSFFLYQLFFVAHFKSQICHFFNLNKQVGTTYTETFIKNKEDWELWEPPIFLPIDKSMCSEIRQNVTELKPQAKATSDVNKTTKKAQKKMLSSYVDQPNSGSKQKMTTLAWTAISSPDGKAGVEPERKQL